MLNLNKTSNSKIKSIDKIIEGMEELLSGSWDKDLDEDYPFHPSLDELLVSVIKWRRTQINNK